MSTTIMFYMNGDNDLTDEVLTAVDKLETVGSSARLHAIALVDGHPDGVARFGEKWVGTHLLHIMPDDEPGRINSKILANWGEMDLGNRATLARFVGEALKRFPADRYMFCTFAHGKGVIDTDDYTSDMSQRALCISPDATSRSIMPLTALESALSEGLNGKRFSLTVLFSCLSGMIEIGYGLRDVTDYMVASEDVIHIVNDPPGSHQLRGIAFEDMLNHLKRNPTVSEAELGRSMIYRFIEPYRHLITTNSPAGKQITTRYPAGLALIDCRPLDRLVAALDDLATLMIDRMQHPQTVAPALSSLHSALRYTPRFNSFLNLEYYDLSAWLDELGRVSPDPAVRQACRRIKRLLHNQVIVFERHTSNSPANGLSIYLGHHLVPDNIYRVHQAMYRQTRFGRDSQLDEMMDVYRGRLQLNRLGMRITNDLPTNRRLPNPAGVWK